MPLGETDRLVTILTKEEGLIRAVAKGARKQPSKLGGKMEPFVVNDLMLARGRWASSQDPQAQLQRVTQAETIQSFPRLGRSLAKLTAAQYLAEVSLIQALAGSDQEELFVILVEHLERLEAAGLPDDVLPLLSHGLYHLLALAGIAPQVQVCLYCEQTINQSSHSIDHDIHFSFRAGGVICDPCRVAHRPKQLSLISPLMLQALQLLPAPILPARLESRHHPNGSAPQQLDRDDLNRSRLLDLDQRLTPSVWVGVEHLLRRLIEYHTETQVRSADLVDSCWALRLASQVNHSQKSQ